MCSSHPYRPAARSLAALLLVGTTALGSGCGKKGDPLPAPRTIPQTASDLKIRQRGLEVVAEFGYPKATVAGLPLAGLDEVTLFGLERPLAAAATATPVATTATAPTTTTTTTAPAATTSTALASPVVPGAGAAGVLALPDKREFTLSAKPILKLTGGELASAISGDRVTVRFLLTEPLPAALAPRFFAVRTHATGGELSDWSNLAGLVPRQPPPPPSGFLAVAAKNGVELSWAAPPETATAAAGSPAAAPGVIAGINVYRRDAARTSYGAPIATLDATATGSVDTAASYGRRYIYAVAAIGSREPLGESALSVEREIDYQDRFGPVPPAGLSALGSVGEVRLVWQASADPDVAGYVIERADPDADFHRVNATPTPELEFTDRGLASGYVFRYRVAAIDKSGNLGIPCEPASTRVP